MQITSSAFMHEERIPGKYTCDGDNISPPLHIFGTPEEAQSLVLIMDDPDVPVEIKPDGVYDHWMIWNIPPETEKIIEGAAPTGIEGKNSSGDPGYTGPCPPDKEHRYFFKIYALDTLLDLDPEAIVKEELLSVMEGHIIRSAELIGRYEREGTS